MKKYNIGMAEKLSPLDASFWNIDTATTRQIIGSYMPLDCVPDLLRVKTSVLKQLEFFPRLRDRVVERNGPYWTQDENFSIEHHVRFEELPEASRPSDIIRRASEIFSTKLDGSRPPWEFVIIANAVQNHGGAHVHCGLLFRLHHALADGLGALEFFHRVCELQRSEANSLPQKPARSHRHAGQTGAGPRAGTANFFQSLKRLIREACETQVQGPLNGPNSAERQFGMIEFPLGELRALRKFFGSSLNDLLLALITGGVRRYQLASAGIADDMKALVPFNVRTRDELTSLGNHLTGVGVRLPSSEADPERRLQIIRATLSHIKNNGSFGAYRIMAKLNALMPVRLQRRISEAAAKRTNFICTNMPGPDKDLYFGGAKLLGQFGFAALMREHGSAFAFMTYAGRACISVVSDPAVITSPWDLIAAIKSSYDELYDLFTAAQPNIQAAES
jgi:WS/DGAT/MGAT family acyltransferase